MIHYNKTNEMDDTDKEINGTDETPTLDSNDVELTTTKATGDPTPPSNNDGEQPAKKKRVPLRLRLARLKRRKAVDDEDALFGRSVASLIIVDADGLTTLNPQLMWLMRILEDEGPTAMGIFRRSSNANICRTVKTQLNNGIKSDQVNVYVASTLFKEWLRCLPDCLLCCDKYDQWLERIQDREHLQRMVNDLPQCNRLLLRHVIRVLHAIHRNSEVTKMTSHNLAVCVGPSLLWSRKATLDSQKADVPRVIAVIQGLIEDAEFIFGHDILEPVQDSATERNTREPDIASSRDQLDYNSDDSETRDRRHVVSTDNEGLEDSGSYEEEEEEEEEPPDGSERQRRRRLSGSFDAPTTTTTTTTTEGSADEDNAVASRPCVKKSPKDSSGDANEASSLHEDEEVVKRKFIRRLAIRRTFGELMNENKHSSNDDHRRHVACSDGAISSDPPPSPRCLPSEPLTNKSHSPEAFEKASEHQSDEGTKQKFFADSFISKDVDLPICEEPTNTLVSSKVKSYENACSDKNGSVDGATGCRQRRGMTGKGSDLFPGALLSDNLRFKSALSWSLGELDHEVNGDAGKCASNRNFRPCERVAESDFEKKVCYDSDRNRRKFERCDGRRCDSDVGESSSSIREERVDNTASYPCRNHNNTLTKFSWKEASTPKNSDQSATKLQRSKKDIETEEDLNAIVSPAESSGKGGATPNPAETREVITSRSHVSSSSSDDYQKPMSNRREYNRVNRAKQSREDTLHDSKLASRFRSKSDSNAVFITRLVIHNDLVEPRPSDQFRPGFTGIPASSSSDSSSEDQLDERIHGRRSETLNQTEANCPNTTDKYQNLTEMLSAIPARSRRPVAMIDPAWEDHTEKVSSAGKNSTEGPTPTWSKGRHGKSAEDVFRDRPVEEPVTRTRTNASSGVVSTPVEPDLVQHDLNVVEALRNVAPRVNLVILRKNELEAKPTNARKSSQSTQNRRLDDCNSSPLVGVSARKSGPLNEKERLISGGKDLARKDGRSFPTAKRVPSIKGNANASRVSPRTRHPNAKTYDTSRDGQLPSRPLETARRSQHTGRPVAQDLRNATVSPPQKIVRLPESTGNSAPPGDKTEPSLRSQPRRTVSRSVSLGQPPNTPSTRLLPVQVNNPVIPEASRRTRSGPRTRRDPPGQTAKSRVNPGKSSPERNPSQTLTGIGDISGTTARTRDRQQPLGGRPSKTNADGLNLRAIRPSAFASARSVEIPQETHLSLFPQAPEAASSSKRREFSAKSDAKRQNPIAQAAINSRRINLIRTQKIPTKP